MTESGVDFKALQNRSLRFFHKLGSGLLNKVPVLTSCGRVGDTTSGGLNSISESNCFGSDPSTIYGEGRAH